MTPQDSPPARDSDSLRVANELYRLGVLLKAKAEHSLRIAELILPAAAAMREAPSADASASSREIMQRLAAFGRGDSFSEQVLAYYARGIAAPNYQHYVEYALSTVQRGRAVAARAARHRAIEGARYLDVGTGWGGYLVAFAEQGAAESVGFEVEEALIRAARANIAEHGVNARVERVDATDARAIAPFGPFDIITCDDVIEHVADPEVLVEHLARLCAPGGVVLLNIPNKRAYGCVLKDPHHGLFGSILLEPEDSLRRFREVFPPHSPYTLGRLWALEETMAALPRHGLEPTLPSSEIRCDEKVIAAVAAGCDQVAEARSNLRQDEGTSPAMRDVLGDAVDRYLEAFRADLERFREAGGAADLPEARDLVARYHLRSHRLICVRPGPEQRPESGAQVPAPKASLWARLRGAVRRGAAGSGQAHGPG